MYTVQYVCATISEIYYPYPYPYFVITAGLLHGRLENVKGTVSRVSYC